MHTLAHPLRRAERTAARGEALVCGDVRLTYGEFVSRCRRLGTVLADLGTVRNDRVAVLAFNSIPFIELYCGVPSAGRVQVPLNFRWADPELAYALEDSGSKVLFIDRDPGPLADLVETVVRLDTGDYESRLATSTEEDFDASVTPDDLAGLFYTGGTTAASKGVMLTHRNLIANTYNSQMLSPIEPGDVYQIIAPLFHAAGSNSVLQCIYQGVPQVIVPAFDPGATLDQIEAEHVTSTLGVPTMLAAQVEAQLASPRDVSSLRVYGHGGSPVATEVIRRAAKAFPATEFVHLYGATETSPLVTGFRHEERYLDEERGRSCGQPVLGVELEIRRPDGTPCPIGEPGEVTASGDNIMAGYWNKPEQTDAVLRDGWYSTGDVGRIDDDGYLYLLDRSKDMIISGGENVYCTEVEEAIYTHPDVLEAAVFGIPDEKWGEVVHAVVVPRAGTEVTPDDIIAHTRESIAGYKVPRSVELRSEELPKSGPGKVLKRELRTPYWADRDTQIN
ncbi:MAG: long-chain fatty acid--CoA ligase [Acidimicrobiia bacterium]|nr:long-chain fatty acid--CoA ligase [Acidimicrobiia bacterium]